MAALACVSLAALSPTSPGVRPTPYQKATVSFGKEQYAVNLQPSARPSPPRPPLLLIPPVGVGIDKSFYNRLHSEWQLLGSPAAVHALDLLGTGAATPKPRRFYSPELWADQIDDYITSHLKEPCVLVVQGGLLPAALEVWRRSGSRCIAAISLLSPLSLSFFSTEEVLSADPSSKTSNLKSRQPTRERKRDKVRIWRNSQASGKQATEVQKGPNPGTSRLPQRLAWAAACSPLGNWFFRRLRGGRPRGARIKDFTQRVSRGCEPSLSSRLEHKLENVVTSAAEPVCKRGRR